MNTNKYIINTLFAGSCLFALASCKKSFLELYPEGNLNTGNFFKTTADFQQAVVGAYTPLRDIANNAYFMDEMRSDNAHYDYYAPDRGNLPIENLIDFLDVPSNAVLQNRYIAAYSGISRTNVVLSRLDNPGFPISDSLKNLIAGEAKALRAHYYFDLVQSFGGVPLYLKEVTNPADAYLPRSSADSVYRQVIADLTDAIAKLPRPNFSNAQTGRVNRGSALTELAAVYLQRKEFGKALPLLDSVTRMGYALQANIRDIFDPARKNGSKELIWDVQFQSGTTGQQSNFIYRFTPRTSNTGVILGVSFNNTIGGWELPTDELLGTFENGDNRLDAFIGIIEGTVNSSQAFTPTRVTSIVNYTQPPGVVAKRFAKKFYYPPYPNLNQNTDQNWCLYRYSDVLLMMAECLNETGRSADALPYLNQVRTRAFGAGNGQVSATDQSTLRGIIAKERRTELCFENKRWHDLVRTDSAITVMNAYGVAAKAKYPYLLPQSYNVTSTRLVYPIPQREIDLNKALVQNPGY